MANYVFLLLASAAVRSPYYEEADAGNVASRSDAEKGSWAGQYICPSYKWVRVFQRVFQRPSKYICSLPILLQVFDFRPDRRRR
jgi:hypothetical protein